MDRNTVAATMGMTRLACVGFALTALACKSPGPVGANSGTPSGGSYGAASNGDDADAATSGGGATAPDASLFINLKTDVPPLWWGVADAEQTPDLPSTPTLDSNCGLLTTQTTRQSADVLLVLDRSASMSYSISADCYCTSSASTFGTLCPDTTNCTTRWSAIEPAVTTTLSSSTYVNWGLKFFPSASTSTTPTGGRGGLGGGGFGNTGCTETTTMEVPISTTAASLVMTQVNGATFDLGTPTTAALQAATAYLKTLDDGNDKFILLATDGQPNCGGNPANINTTDVDAAAAAAQVAYDAGFPVFVVGIGPNLDNLTALAKAGSGGANDYFQVSSPQDLVDALSKISKMVGSCNFNSTTPPPDPNNIAVYVNGQIISQSKDNGWTFGTSSQEIVLTGDFCKAMSSGDKSDVQILFGCPGQPDFPQSIY